VRRRHAGSHQAPARQHSSGVRRRDAAPGQEHCQRDGGRRSSLFRRGVAAATRRHPPAGSTVAAPGSLANAVSDLSAVFQQHGRNGPWQSSSGSGNSCHSEPMKALQQGYSKEPRLCGVCRSAPALQQLRTSLKQLAAIVLQQPTGSLAVCGGAPGLHGDTGLGHRHAGRQPRRPAAP